MTHVPPRCWCGTKPLEQFSPEYLRCPVCETLVTARMPADDITAVSHDDQGFYGREYWFSHQEQDLGFSNVTERARADLPERCLHWLTALLKYKLPPGRTLELGSAHGGFVALMQWSGFDASGLELSPWVVDFARRSFDVPMMLGTLERQQVAAGSLDAIALMDVLEHLPDPVGTMRRALDLLKPDGLLLVQTPCYVEGRTHAEMVSSADPFLDQLKAVQHLYLYSPRAIRQLFHDLGASHVVSEPAIFAHYDQFVVVSRAPLPVHDAAAMATALSASARGRMVLALLDARARERDVQVQRAQLEAELVASEADRAARLALIQRQGSELARLPALEAALAASEADRAARLTVIERQGSELGRIPHLEAQLAASEADRALRLDIIQRQAAQIGGLQKGLTSLQDRLASAGRLVGGTSRVVGRLLLGPRWFALENVLSGPTDAQNQPSPESESRRWDLVAYTAEIDRFNRAQPNTDLLDQIRAYNHAMIDALHRARPLKGKRVLDIGASPHGYALERALQLGAEEYVGVGLDVHESIDVRSPSGTASLRAMNAEHLAFPDASYDLVFSASTFEHVSDVAQVLAEIRRVLKRGGSALITFEPVWTASYGHHLHHFGPVSKLMPDWAHLVWDQRAMRSALAAAWPPDAALTLEEASHWVYESDALNRVPIGQMRGYFAACGMQLEWIVSMPDTPRDPDRLREVALHAGFSEDDLMSKGLSVLLNNV